MLRGLWVEPDIRDAIVQHLQAMMMLTGLRLKTVLPWVGIPRSKYYEWCRRLGSDPVPHGPVPRGHWLLSWEREAIIAFAKEHPAEGYRRLTYMMLDADIVAVSPSSTYRVLRDVGLLQRWNTVKSPAKAGGFEQPLRVHEHWHTDIKYVNFRGTFLFLISVFDGFSRMILHHELRTSMQEYDVEITLQRALEKYPDARPRLISDNGKQFIARDFGDYLRQTGLQHVRTSIGYPQSNGKIERYHRTITQECLRRTSFIDLDDARRQIARYVESYNTKRLHSAVYYLTPQEVFEGRMSERLEQREAKLARAAEQRRAYHRAA